jgi:hypothetical protein
MHFWVNCIEKLQSLNLSLVALTCTECVVGIVALVDEVGENHLSVEDLTMKMMDQIDQYPALHFYFDLAGKGKMTIIQSSNISLTIGTLIKVRKGVL